MQSPLCDLVEESRDGGILTSVSVSWPRRHPAAAVRMRYRDSASRTEPALGGVMTVTTCRRDVWLIWECGRDLHRVHADVINAAWCGGAWDVARWDYGPLIPGDVSMRLGVSASFCGDPYAVCGDSGPDPTGDQWKMDSIAAEHGYTTWLYKPHLGNLHDVVLAHRARLDATLDSDGGRTAVKRIAIRNHDTRIRPGVIRRVVHRLGETP